MGQSMSATIQGGQVVKGKRADQLDAHAGLGMVAV